MKLQHVVIARPGGNNTALVFDPIPTSEHKTINDYILAKDSSVEQVMFVKTSSLVPEGRMAGGEFCGNATRSLGFYLLGGKNGSITLSISGTSSPLEVKVIEGSAHTQMPIRKNLSSIEQLGTHEFLVRLEGITHLVFDEKSDWVEQFALSPNIEADKRLAKGALEKFDLLKEAAAGVMFLTKDDDQLCLHPFVYVRDIDTFFAETACGSGSVAVGLVFAKRDGKSISGLSLRQPSGQNISVNIDLNNHEFSRATIEGGVDIIHDGPF